MKKHISQLIIAIYLFPIISLGQAPTNPVAEIKRVESGLLAPFTASDSRQPNNSRSRCGSCLRKLLNQRSYRPRRGLDFPFFIWSRGLRPGLYAIAHSARFHDVTYVSVAQHELDAFLTAGQIG
jgi:hypothetical protein